MVQARGVSPGRRDHEMTIREWAEANGLTEVYNQYVEDCEAIAEQCAQEGYPSRGSNYELRVEELKQSYPELFAADDDKYWLDCDSNEGAQFALYKITEDGDVCVMKFDFEDINGLKDCEEKDRINEAYKLMDKYIEEKLGFLPDYEVG